MLTNGKTFRKTKTPPGEFQVTTPKNLLINNQAVISIRNLTTTLVYPKIPTYNWTFTSISNWTWSCSKLLRFPQISNLWLASLHGFQYVTNSSNLIDCVGYKILHFINDENQEALGYKTLRRTNAVASHKVYEFWVSDSVLDNF